MPLAVGKGAAETETGSGNAVPSRTGRGSEQEQRIGSTGGDSNSISHPRRDHPSVRHHLPQRHEAHGEQRCVHRILSSLANAPKDPSHITEVNPFDLAVVTTL